MKIVILYGLGNVGKSYTARKLLPVFAARNEATKYVCMDNIVGCDKINAGFNFRSVNTYVLREQDNYLSDIMNVLFSSGYEGDGN